MTIIKISLKEIFSHLKIVGTVNNTCTQRAVKSVGFPYLLTYSLSDLRNITPKVSSLPIFSDLLSNFFSLLTCFIPYSVSPHPTLVFFLPCLLSPLFPHLSLALILFLIPSIPLLSSFPHFLPSLFPSSVTLISSLFPFLSYPFHPSPLPPLNSFPPLICFFSYSLPSLLYSLFSIHPLPFSVPSIHPLTLLNL